MVFTSLVETSSPDLVVRDSLKKYKLYDNTIIIYLSDNGPNGNRWNNDFKDRKGSTNEGGVRVPFFIQWPNNIKKGLKINQVSSVLDLFPTLLELTGNKARTNQIEQKAISTDIQL